MPSSDTVWLSSLDTPFHCPCSGTDFNGDGKPDYAMCMQLIEEGGQVRSFACRVQACLLDMAVQAKGSLCCCGPAHTVASGGA